MSIYQTLYTHIHYIHSGVPAITGTSHSPIQPGDAGLVGDLSPGSYLLVEVGVPHAVLEVRSRLEVVAGEEWVRIVGSSRYMNSNDIHNTVEVVYIINITTIVEVYII